MRVLRVVVSGRAHGFLHRAFAGRPNVRLVEIEGLHLDFADNLEVVTEVAEDGFEPEIVFSDFESWAYLYGRSRGIPVISIDNMQILNRCVQSDAPARRVPRVRARDGRDRRQRPAAGVLGAGLRGRPPHRPRGDRERRPVADGRGGPPGRVDAVRPDRRPVRAGVQRALALRARIRDVERALRPRDGGDVPRGVARIRAPSPGLCPAGRRDAVRLRGRARPARRPR